MIHEYILCDRVDQSLGSPFMFLGSTFGNYLGWEVLDLILFEDHSWLLDTWCHEDQKNKNSTGALLDT